MKVKQALDCFPVETEGHGQERGVRARERLLAEATRIFAEKGYARASTREICLAADQNVAAIHYYFGDKAGLYRAALLRPIEEAAAALEGLDAPALPVEAAMRQFIQAMLCVPAAGAPPDPEMRLFLREMIEPSSAFQDIVAQHVMPLHQRMVALLARHTGAKAPDDDLHQLAFAISAMVNDHCMSRPFMDALAPGLLHGPQALERVLDRLVAYALALVAHERQRRQATGSSHRAAARPDSPSPSAPPKRAAQPRRKA